ncbi:hypothetical protein [Sulfurovum sp. AR]|uniref:hypothetical protein n=1 Tax=Sulfurovum sp. AR TaxID=1165841 RepID=UPI00025C4AC0|nr:hypothetical protein [Sulfurovum sp. AR]EIF50248.1 hypothetical protein SULAR_09249 [Sulfurovum sp. AR]
MKIDKNYVMVFVSYIVMAVSIHIYTMNHVFNYLSDPNWFALSLITLSGITARKYNLLIRAKEGKNILFSIFTFFIIVLLYFMLFRIYNYNFINAKKGQWYYVLFFSFFFIFESRYYFMSYENLKKEHMNIQND